MCDKNVNEVMKKLDCAQKDVNEVKKNLSCTQKDIKEIEKNSNCTQKNVDEIKKNLESTKKTVNEVKDSLHSTQKTVNEIKEILQKKETEDDKEFYSSSKCLKISICLIGLLIFTGIVSYNCLFKCNDASKSVTNPPTSQSSELKTSVKYSDNEIKVSVTNKIKKTDSYSVAFIVLLVIYGVLLISVISLLIYLAIKDDGDIRFAKLNEMRNLRRSLIRNEKINLEEKDVSEKIEFLGAEKCNNNDNNNSDKNSSNVNKIIPIKKIESYKNMQADFLKNYLNTISEI